MTTNKQAKEILRSLQKAIVNDDWSMCRETLTRLLPFLDQGVVLQLMLNQIQRFLIEYLDNASQDESIQKSLDMLRDIDSFVNLQSQASLVHKLLKDKAGTPGINNYRNALKELYQLEKLDTSSNNTNQVIVDIISGTIMGTLDYSWGSRNPELWSKSFHLETKSDYFIRADRFISDPKIIRLRASLWNQVADDIEAFY